MIIEWTSSEYYQHQRYFGLGYIYTFSGIEPEAALAWNLTDFEIISIADLAAMFDDSAWPITYTAPGEDAQETRAVLEHGKGEEFEGADRYNVSAICWLERKGDYGIETVAHGAEIAVSTATWEIIDAEIVGDGFLWRCVINRINTEDSIDLSGLVDTDVLADLAAIYASAEARDVTYTESGESAQTIPAFVMSGQGDQFDGADRLGIRAVLRALAYGSDGVLQIDHGAAVIHEGATWDVISARKVNDGLEWEIEINRRQ